MRSNRLSIATNLTTTGTGNIVLDSAGDLTLTNAVGSAAEVELDAGRAISESSAGTITATTLTGSSVTGATLDGANQIGVLGSFSNTGSGDFSLTDAQALIGEWPADGRGGRATSA